MAMLPSLFGTGGVDRVLEDMRRMQDRIEQAFGSMAPMPVMRADWRPAIDVKETETGLAVTAELPGMTEQDVERGTVEAGEHRLQHEQIPREIGLDTPQ